MVDSDPLPSTVTIGTLFEGLMDLLLTTLCGLPPQEGPVFNLILSHQNDFAPGMFQIYYDQNGGRYVWQHLAPGTHQVLSSGTFERENFTLPQYASNPLAMELINNQQMVTQIQF